MARSLRDELLKAGLVTSEQAARAERGSRPPPKPAGSRKSREGHVPEGHGRPTRLRHSLSSPRKRGASGDPGVRGTARPDGHGRPARIEDSRPFPKPAGSEPAENRAAERTAKRRSRDASKQRLQGQGPGSAVPATSPAADPEAQVRQLNLEIRHILDTEAEKAEAEGESPFHFPRGVRVKRLYVSGDQRRRLANGGLAIVGFRGRHHLVPRAAGERVRALRPEVFVFIASDEDGAGAAEEGYEGYEVPDELVW